MALAIH
jgi:hypothetical protein